jgi:uncharacterized protein YjbI with pentapeptide repeats
MEALLKPKLLRTVSTTSFALAGLVAIAWLVTQGYSASWTGFGKSALQAKTLWDWLQLLLVPLFLGGATLVLHSSQRESVRKQAEERSALEREIETDRQQEEALQMYFDRIIELCLKEKLSKFSPEEVRTAARTRTLAVLRGLDGKRKGMVVLFLKDSNLIDREAVIDLAGADLREASLAFANLKRANLGEADLSKADLRGANLTKAYLGATNFLEADLRGANLNEADLFESNLNGADITRANLRAANLSGADLRGSRLNDADIRDADLSGVNLNVSDMVGANLRGAKLEGVKLLGANLSQADLSGTQINRTELQQAKSLEGATLPDGSKHLQSR